jgi:chloramphenicol 3-O-phosphotransferase
VRRERARWLPLFVRPGSKPDTSPRSIHTDVLVYLDVDYETIRARRPRLQLRREHLAEQKRRLEHARQHSDLYLDTVDMSPAEVQMLALSFLENVLAVE